MTESKGSRGLTIEVDVDVSEALTGLKALQREAKKATQALRELEEAQNDFNKRQSIDIVEIQAELSRRMRQHKRLGR